MSKYYNLFSIHPKLHKLTCYYASLWVASGKINYFQTRGCLKLPCVVLSLQRLSLLV